jgi:hypothetical protein
MQLSWFETVEENFQTQEPTQLISIQTASLLASCMQTRNENFQTLSQTQLNTVTSPLASSMHANNLFVFSLKEMPSVARVTWAQLALT